MIRGVLSPAALAALVLLAGCTKLNKTEIASVEDGFGKYLSQKPFAPSLILTSHTLISSGGSNYLNLSGWDTGARTLDFLNHIHSLYPPKDQSNSVPVLITGGAVADQARASYAFINNHAGALGFFVLPILGGHDSHENFARAFICSNLAPAEKTICEANAGSFRLTGELSHQEVSPFVHWRAIIVDVDAVNPGSRPWTFSQSKVDQIGKTIQRYRNTMGSENFHVMLLSAQDITSTDPGVIEAATQARMQTLLTDYPEIKLIFHSEEIRPKAPAKVPGLAHEVWTISVPPISYKADQGSQSEPNYLGYMEAELGLKDLDLYYYSFNDPEQGPGRQPRGKFNLKLR